MADLYAPQVTRLPNGLQVIAVERPASNTFAATLAIRGGFNDDPPSLPGLAHAVEHVSFFGANRDLAKVLARNGAQVNAQTGPEVTAWYVTGHVDQLDLALQLFANVLSPQPLTVAELEAEKQILGHEYSDTKESAREKAYSSYHAKVYGIANMPNEDRLKKQLKKITPTAVAAFQSRHFRAGNACLAIVAPADFASLDEMCREHLGHDRISSAADTYTPAAIECERVTKIFADNFRYVWLFSSHVVSNTSAPMRLVASIVHDLLGGGPHSDLFRGLRDERSLAYSVGAWKLNHLNSTAISCHSTVNCRSTLEALRVMLERQNAMARGGLTEEQFDEARTRIRRYHEMSLDHPRGLSWYLAYDGLRAPEEQLLNGNDLTATLASLSLDDANQLVKELLAPKNRSVFVGGMLWMLGRWRARRLIQAMNSE